MSDSISDYFSQDSEDAYNAMWVAKGVWPHNTPKPTWWGKDKKKMAQYAKDCYGLKKSELKFLRKRKRKKK